MLPTSARVDVLSPPPRRGMARAACASRWSGGPTVTGGLELLGWHGLGKCG
jgi:hypothetical protein